MPAFKFAPNPFVAFAAPSMDCNSKVVLAVMTIVPSHTDWFWVGAPLASLPNDTLRPIAVSVLAVVFLILLLTDDDEYAPAEPRK